ncbi:MAG: 6,7-dimethyl-8-ribityllumazine synthase [Kiritimatiellae bacterium]|nr:6,7-dimethyl-8-ribityllumazine synthase [Kiritimatiellia bacterium]
MTVKETGGSLTAQGLKFVIVISRFNDFLTSHLKAGALDCLTRHGAAEENIEVVWVPGANEIPAVVEKLAARKKADAYIALGAVIQGATPHAGLINAQVSRSLAKTAGDHGVPVINGVVCADNLEQAIERCGTKAGNKGWQAALAAIEMANLYRALDSRS